MVVAVINAATFVLPSSKRTLAIAPSVASDTSTASTPDTLLSARFTIGPQSSQVALATFSVTVCSAAKAAPLASRDAVRAIRGKVFIRNSLRLGSEEEPRCIGKAHGDDDQNRCDPKAYLGVAMGRRTRAVGPSMHSAALGLR